MNRTVKKYIQDYERLFKDNDKFSCNDMMQIYDIYNNSSKPKNDSLWDAISGALMFGFMVGMKYGLNKKGGTDNG